MHNLIIDKDFIEIKMKGIKKFATLKNKLVIPISDLAGVTFDPGVSDMFPKAFDLKLGGTWIPKIYTGGTFIQNREKIFWDVARPDKAIVMTLVNNKYAKVIIDVDNPTEIVNKIEKIMV